MTTAGHDRSELQLAGATRTNPISLSAARICRSQGQANVYKPYPRIVDDYNCLRLQEPRNRSVFSSRGASRVNISTPPRSEFRSREGATEQSVLSASMPLIGQVTCVVESTIPLPY